MQEEAEHALRRGSHSPRRVDRLCIETGLRRDFNSLGCRENSLRNSGCPAVFTSINRAQILRRSNDCNWHEGDPSRTRSVPVRSWGVQLTRPTGPTFPLGNDLMTHTAADQGIATAQLRWHEASVDSVPWNLSRYSFG